MTQAPHHFEYYGCALPKMHDSSVVVGMCLQLKVMNPDGEISYREFSHGLSKMEQLGMVISMGDTLRHQIMASGHPGPTTPPENGY